MFPCFCDWHSSYSSDLPFGALIVSSGHGSAPDPLVLGGGLPGDSDLRLCYLGDGSRGAHGEPKKRDADIFPIISIHFPYFLYALVSITMDNHIFFIGKLLIISDYKLPFSIATSNYQRVLQKPHGHTRTEMPESLFQRLRVFFSHSVGEERLVYGRSEMTQPQESNTPRFWGPKLIQIRTPQKHRSHVRCRLSQARSLVCRLGQVQSDRNSWNWWVLESIGGIKNRGKQCHFHHLLGMIEW